MKKAKAREDDGYTEDERIRAIREAANVRRAALKMQLRINNQCYALARDELLSAGSLVWADLDEKQRGTLCTTARERVDAVFSQCRKDNKPEMMVTLSSASIEAFFLQARIARDTFDVSRTACEHVMEAHAKRLLVWPWVESVKGMGALGLARIVADAGNLSNYPTVAKLWKRMGVAVMNGCRQGKPADPNDPNEWIEHGYCPERRSTLYVITDSLLRTNDDGYRALYLERKPHEAARPDVKTKAHAHNAAMRYVGKRLLRDLWRAWRDCHGHSATATPAPRAQSVASASPGCTP